MPSNSWCVNWFSGKWGTLLLVFGMLLGERGVLTEASLFRTRPNHVHTYFIKYSAAEYATLKPDGNLTLSSPCESLARETNSEALHFARIRLFIAGMPPQKLN